MKRAKRNHRNGQTLLEAIVALGVLTAGFLGIVALLSRSFAIDKQNANRTTATYLAAEGIELTKNILDHGMYYSAVGWPCFSYNTRDYQFDFTVLQSTPLNCSSLSGDVYNRKELLLDNEPGSRYFGLYGYNGAFPQTDAVITTGFTRDIAISFPASMNGNEAVVKSTVHWDNGSQTVSLEDHFYNWLP